MPTKTWNVLIVEDNALMRGGLQLAIDSEDDLNVVGTAANGLDALDCWERLQPDIILMDVQMPKMDGIACIKEIRKQDDQVRIVILTTFNEEEYIFEGLASGANGYLLKSLDVDKLIRTIRDAANDAFVLPAEVAAKVARYAVNNSQTVRQQQMMNRFMANDTRFTDKERQMISLLLLKLSNKEIAARLALTEGTVKNKLTVIYDKLNANSRHDAARLLNEYIHGFDSGT
ncbi:response regulator [Cohnella sp. GCM10020058]|uniref:response regulator transcription factor n=1 Tax=Cohnella sp. GCM10020058 TaxID=3317330 RepID=UPI00363A0AEB